MRKITSFLLITLLLSSCDRPPVTMRERVDEAVPIKEAPFGEEARNKVLKECGEAFDPSRYKDEFNYCVSRIPFDGDFGSKKDSTS